METMLKPYSEYLWIDLPWQQRAPAHWTRLRLKHLLHEVDERTQTGEEPLLSLTRSWGLVRRSEITDKPPSAKTLIGYKVCRPGDIVMNRMQAWSGMFGFASEIGLVSPDYAVLRLTGEADGGFLLSLLKSPGPVSHFAALSTGMGSGFNRLYTDQLGAVPIATPPYEEQVQAASVIRAYDRRVIRLIRTKQRLIALLNEQKQAIIQRAVTRGLDPDVPLKPSGVDWLGDVPEHWKVIRVKHLLREVDERTQTGEGELLSLTRSRGLVRRSEIADRPHSASTLVGYKICRPGDIVMNRMQAWSGMFGLASEVGLVSPDYAVLRQMRSVDPTFMVHLLKSPSLVSQFAALSKGIGSGFNRLYTNQLGTVSIALPPLDEQRDIVAFLKDGMKDIELALRKTKSEIDLIREYRTRLIADVVTGKLDVRGVAVPEVEGDGINADLKVSGDDDADLMDEVALTTE